MELIELEELIDNMILQLSYPGFDAKAFNLALPDAANKAPAKLFSQALDSKNVIVQLTALRWFQMRSSAAKNCLKSIVSLLQHEDPWVKKEAIKTIEGTKVIASEVLKKICYLLKDENPDVRKEAAKSLGNLAKEIDGVKSEKDMIIEALKESSEDPVLEVRRKAIKALRKLKAFSNY